MSRYFAHAEEHIRERLYDVWIPAFYHPNVPADMFDDPVPSKEAVNKFTKVLMGTRLPIPMVHTPDPEQMQKSSQPIEVMIDMHRRKIEFELFQFSDIVDIFDSLDRYLYSLQSKIEAGDERCTKYALHVLSFREKAFIHYFRFMQENPLAKEKLYPNNSTKNNIFSLMVGMGGDADELDPLRARRNPPFAIKPKERHELAVGDAGFVDGLGISQSHVLLDDGKGLDLESFLKG